MARQKLNRERCKKTNITKILCHCELCYNEEELDHYGDAE